MHWQVTASWRTPSRAELDGRGQGSNLAVHFFGPVRFRRGLLPGDGVGGEQALRGNVAPGPLDYHGAGQGEVGVQVADGEVEAVFETFVLRVPQGMKGFHPGMAVDGPQARESRRELPDFVIAVAAPYGLVGHDQFVRPGGLPPGQQGHGFAAVAGINGPEKGHGRQEQGRGQGRGVEQDFGPLGLKPGNARGWDHGLEKRRALHQE